MKDDDANNTDDPALDFIRQIIRRACWAVSYHEVRLPIVYRNSKFAQELVGRAGFADLPGDPDYDPDDDNYENIEAFARHLVNDPQSSIAYHEEQLRKASDNLAMAKIMLARGGYTEAEINVAEIAAGERAKAEESVDG